MALRAELKEPMLAAVNSNVSHLVLLNGTTEVTTYEAVAWNAPSVDTISMTSNILFNIDTTGGDVTVDGVKLTNVDGTVNYGSTSTTAHTFTSDGTYNLETLEVSLP